MSVVAGCACFCLGCVVITLLVISAEMSKIRRVLEEFRDVVEEKR